MVYSDVIKNEWHKILPKKEKYTKRDVDCVWLESFFNGHGTFTEQQAKFIVRCTAIFHDAEYSTSVATDSNAYPIF